MDPFAHKCRLTLEKTRSTELIPEENLTRRAAECKYQQRIPRPILSVEMQRWLGAGYEHVGSRSEDELSRTTGC